MEFDKLTPGKSRFPRPPSRLRLRPTADKPAKTFIWGFQHQRQAGAKGVASMSRMRLAITVAIIVAVGLMSSPVGGTYLRIKDLATVVGTSPQPLMGYGLVVGLEGSGDTDRTIFTAQSLANMLEQIGVQVNLSQVAVKNVAAVAVTADLPAFAAKDSTMDATVSSLGDAKSLQGGMLLPTPLRAGDGQVYAIAQGPVSLGGFNVGGRGDRVTKNHPVVGRVPNGSRIIRDISGELQKRQTSARSAEPRLTLTLQQPDFTTAARIAERINTELTPGTAQAVNAAIVEVNMGNRAPAEIVEFITSIEKLQVQPDEPARVVINERTGTVVIGQKVRILPVAIAHGSLTVQIHRQWQVSQPPSFSETGATVVVPAEGTTVEEEAAALMQIEVQTSLEDLVVALNALGVSPRDLIAIIQALKQAGALQAELVVM